MNTTQTKVPEHIQNTLDLLAEARRDLGNEVLNGGQLSTIILLARSAGWYEAKAEDWGKHYGQEVDRQVYREINRIKDETPWLYNSSL